MTIASHTIVKNGMPFIEPVLRQVAPYMDKMFIAVSHYSTDGTLNAVMRFIGENPGKVEFIEEGETNPARLTNLRQFQAERTKQNWILFLDDDDFWPHDQLEACLKELSDNLDGLGVSPYQVLDKENYDSSCNKKYYTKFFRNEDINYRGDWPRDMIYKGNELLYWKTNPRVRVVPHKFYHLGAVKPHSFRKDDLPQFAYKVGKKERLPNPLPREIMELL